MSANAGTAGSMIVNTATVFDAYVPDIYLGNNSATVIVVPVANNFVKQNSQLIWIASGTTTGSNIINGQ